MRAGEEVLVIVVRGRVQGVGFRAFTERVARQLGVPGWVRNLPSGEVQVVARVHGGNRLRLLANLRQGPPGSRVDAVSSAVAGPEVQCPTQGFTVRF
ncbi:MAG TPA: acylphosphatase [bacterium]|nr:acylphosphatase [bacterium]